MSDYIDFTTPVKTARAQVFATRAAGGTLRLYSGTRPASADDAITDQVMLLEMDIPDPSGTVANGVWTGAAVSPGMIAVTGTPTWGRYADASDADVCDADVGTVGSGAAIIVDNASFVEGALATVVSQTITEG
jgi:hypothetical protein